MSNEEVAAENQQNVDLNDHIENKKMNGYNRKANGSALNQNSSEKNMV